MTKQRRNYSILLTQRCDQACTYCDFPSIDRPQEASYDGIRALETIATEMLPKGSSVAIVGGEPGTLPVEKMRRAIVALKEAGHSVEVSTNGLFVHAFDFGEIPQVDTILLHHTHPTSFQRKPWWSYDKDRVKHTVVIRRPDAWELNMWASEAMRAGVKIDPKLMHMRVDGSKQGGYSQEELNVLGDAMLAHPAVIDDAGWRLKKAADLKRRGTAHEHIIKCAQAAPALLVDLVKMRTVRCSRSYTTFDERDISLESLADEWPIETAKLGTCVSCTRCFNV